jgi:hypothetical protein
MTDDHRWKLGTAPEPTEPAQEQGDDSILAPAVVAPEAPAQAAPPPGTPPQDDPFAWMTGLQGNPGVSYERPRGGPTDPAWQREVVMGNPKGSLYEDRLFTRLPGARVIRRRPVAAGIALAAILAVAVALVVLLR